VDFALHIETLALLGLLAAEELGPRHSPDCLRGHEPCGESGCSPVPASCQSSHCVLCLVICANCQEWVNTERDEYYRKF
jgi:hypothetical protein